MAQPSIPTLVFIVGPPAVGKMTVGQALSVRTGFPLFHNHQTIDLVLRYFPYGSPPFRRLVSEFRHRVLEEIAASALPGLIFTYVWAFDDPTDAAAVERYADIFRRRGGQAVFVELQATQVERLRRSNTPFRLAEKPGMRDVAAAQARLVELDAQYRLSSDGAFDGRADYLRLDTMMLTPEAAADFIAAHFQLPPASDREAAT